MAVGYEAGGEAKEATIEDGYQQIEDYGLIGDQRGAALVSRDGSIDWCCVPRFDSGSCFARLLDREHGGFCAITPRGEQDRPTFREYVGDTMVLATTFRTPGGQARLIDCFTLADEGSPEIVRIVEGQRGAFEFELRVEPRFDYGAVDPWVRHHGVGLFSAIGGDDGLLIWSDLPLELDGRHALASSGEVRPGERARLVIGAVDPAELEREEPAGSDPAEVDERVERTCERWSEWAAGIDLAGPDQPGAVRSALVLEALTYAPTGAIAAAPTTSLPEGRGHAGARNWDYRYSWVRDSALAVRSLARLGFEREAAAFRRFVERSAAGNAKDLQVVFGIGGERRLQELEVELEGYRGAAPVRVGNDAHGQLQLDAYGQLLDHSWQWYMRGHEPDDDYWRFLLELVDAAVEHWRQPDAGIWEQRGEPRHFTHSKALCWVAVDRGLRLAEACLRKAPERRWKRAGEEIREAVAEHGYDSDRGVFVRSFDGTDLDAALLRLPAVGFVDYDDERMIRTVDAIREELGCDGLLRRYRPGEGQDVEEGAFLACSFWLAECLAGQGRLEQAREAFDRAISTANGLGLYSEQYDPEAVEMLGNFPQALSHLSHLEAVLAIAEAEGAATTSGRGTR